MEIYIKMYLEYLEKTKGIADNTFLAYKRDLENFSNFLMNNKSDKLDKINQTNILTYLFELKKQGKSPSTVYRSISTLRGFFKFLYLKGIIKIDPTVNVEVPEASRNIPAILSVAEVKKLLDSIDGDDKKSIRDKAMLELVYATGIRVSELIELKCDDVDLMLNVIEVKGKKKNRIIPFGKECAKLIKRYLDEVRGQIVKGDDDTLFLNIRGGAMTRQAFWQIVKANAKKVNIEKEIMPQTLRHSFAVHTLQNGMGLNTLAEMLGIDDINGVSIYSEYMPEKTLEAYKKAHPLA